MSNGLYIEERVLSSLLAEEQNTISGRRLADLFSPCNDKVNIYYLPLTTYEYCELPACLTGDTEACLFYT